MSNKKNNAAATPPVQEGQPAQVEKQYTPQELLLKLIISNTQILQKMALALEQQIIYTNALLFPNNDGTNTKASTSPSGQTNEGNK